MSDLKKNMTKVLPLKSKKKSPDTDLKKEKKLDSTFNTKEVVSLEVLDPKLKAIQDAIDRGLYKIPSHLITESFLEKSNESNFNINKKAPNEIDADNVGIKLKILKKNKE